MRDAVNARTGHLDLSSCRKKDIRMKKSKANPCELLNIIKWYNVRIMGIPGAGGGRGGDGDRVGRVRERAENLFKKIMAEMTQIWRETFIQLHGAYRCPNRYNPKKASLRHIIIKLSKIQGKGKNSDSSKRKGTRRIQGAPIRLSIHFSAENTMVKGERFFSEIRKQNKDVHCGYLIQHGAESPSQNN